MRALRCLNALASVVAVVFCITSLDAQTRTVDWPEFSVQARLDADGRLHVVETQVIRFIGEWNGGYRAFERKKLGQKITVTGIERLDTLSGEWRPLRQGDLDQVDAYDWVEGQLRWRSRNPNDPPFAGEHLTYRIHATYDNILQPKGGDEYVLDHDFAFAQRDGVISRFALTLGIDSAWRVPDSFTGRYETEMLPPGEGFVVTVPLTRVAVGRPDGVVFGAPAAVRYGLLLALGAAFVGLFLRLMARERRLGRDGPLTRSSEITPEWLEQNVFVHRPEEAGAAWDDNTASPEVAATLARLVQERKLSSTVTSKGFLIFKSPILSLKLQVPRDRFKGYERQLIDALFEPGSERTDTEKVRERYKKTGFDPAGVIRESLTTRVGRMAPGGGETPSRTPGLVLLAASIVLLIAGGIARPNDIPIAAVAVAGSLPFYLASMAFAYGWRGRVSELGTGALGFLIALGIPLGVFVVVLLLSTRVRVGGVMLVGITLWLVTIVNSVFNFAKSRQSPERIAKRKQLAAAREFFEQELQKREPALRDEWFPYVLAFGLGRHIDKWFDAFGGEHVSSASRMASGAAVAASASSGSRGGGWTGFGGGGGFGGAGGGASFGAALGSMAAAVPSPSSSSGGGGGGGGGGGSSGGGGGGGW